MSEAAYRQGYRYLRELIGSVDSATLAGSCPHCPEWSLKGVLAHLMLVAEGGVAVAEPANFRKRVYDSIVNDDDDDQRAASIERDRAWNSAVENADALSVDQIWERWEDALDEESASWTKIVDFAVHVGDIEEALGAVESRNYELHGISLRRYVELSNENLKVRGLPAVRLECSDSAVRAGDEAAPITICGTTYELLRVMTGRRTIAEADEQLEWPDISQPVKELLPVYGWLSESRQHLRAT